MIVGAEAVQPYTLLVRENYYGGEFGTVKAASRRRAVPRNSIVVAALVALRSRGEFRGPGRFGVRHKQGNTA